MRAGIAAGLSILLAIVIVPLRTRVPPLEGRPLSFWTEAAATIVARAPLVAMEHSERMVRIAPERRAEEPKESPIVVTAAGAERLPGYAAAVVAAPGVAQLPVIETLERPLALTSISGALGAQPPLVPPRARPRALPLLYTSFATLQALDAVSTWRAMRSGNVRELNPLLTNAADNLPALLAIKAASTAVSIYAVEKLRVRNRKAAVATMIGLNIAYAYVVAENLEVGRGQRARARTR
jgi:hypothetical protein